MRPSVLPSRLLTLCSRIGLVIAVVSLCGGMVQSEVALAFKPSQQTPPDSDLVSLDPSTTVAATNKVFLPIVGIRWSRTPNAPTLNPIANSDYDNIYTVSWSRVTPDAVEYALEEATNATFSSATVVYRGSNLYWSVSSTGKTPASYYYRIKATNEWGSSGWSTAKSVTIYPLFIGLHLRWDGRGYIRDNDPFDVGYHVQRTLDVLTDADTVRSNNNSWYDPNPQGWSSSQWYSYYSVTTGQFRATSVPPDPSWKWSRDWILPYAMQFVSGQTVQVDHQPFRVTGPHSGYTAFGKPVQYWELTNTTRFLYWSPGGDWTQYVSVGAAKLRYDAGSTKLLIYADVLRTYYYRGSPTSYTVQYIDILTAASSFPALSMTNPNDLDNDPQDTTSSGTSTDSLGHSGTAR